MPTARKKSVSPQKMENKITTIKQSVFIPAPPEQVYAAYLDERQHSAMTGGKAKFQAREGGTFSAWDGYISGTIFELEQGKRIVQDWITTDWPNGYSRSILSLTFKPKAKGTELRLIQECVPLSQVKDFEQGWKDFYWTPMQKYFSGAARESVKKKPAPKKKSSTK